ncbi:MAG: glycoside hydrolase family 15 protein [Planctomycetota bacterium]|jgi:GH15 family glucan-1,4-alpha-glucosidase
MKYKRVDEYGIIGDLHTAALVGTDGSIDWCCLPHFDSPSIFAAILDVKKGGHFKVAGVGEVDRRQMYYPESNILITRFSESAGVVRVMDFMPIHEGQAEAEHPHAIVRHAQCVRGETRVRMECFPALDYARASHRVIEREGSVVFESEGGERLGFAITRPYEIQDGGVVSEFTLREGEGTAFVLRLQRPGEECVKCSEEEARQLSQRTIEYWRRWLGKATYQGRWREVVHRSLLALKLLTFAPTGAIVAAPTTSLPESVGGGRNFDYRYTWLRDAAFTLYGFMRVGLTEEARQFMRWLEGCLLDFDEKDGLRSVYAIEGRRIPAEEELRHLEGYRGSRPVRIGNDAAGQFQLDVYGELMDSVYLYNKYGTPISYDLWTQIRRILDWVARNWRRPDQGIWEVRGGRQHFVYSKLMCWVALDRGLRLAAKRSFPGNREVWERERDSIYEELMARGWSNERSAFVQYYDSRALDAANLVMPLVFFVSPSDPRMVSTVDATLRELTSDSLVRRYDPGQAADDGFTGDEGTFSLCTFWLVECLTRQGRLDEARFLFERMLGYANHLRLYSEEVGLTGEALGNFPQAFTHLTLVSAAYNLDRFLSAAGNSGSVSG